METLIMNVIEILTVYEEYGVEQEAGDMPMVEYGNP